MSPRPILKRAVPTEHHHHQRHIHPNPNHAVHFPPSPALARTFSAYSAAAYDRSPIVVSPNTCALPERGCPGRTYLLDEQASAPSQRRISYARDYHPRALAFASSSSVNYDPVPPLVADLSSESEESDSFPSLPGELVSNQTFGPHGLAGPHNNSMSTYKNNSAISVDVYTPCDDQDTLAFLPYPPSSPNSSIYFPQDISEDQLQKLKARRRRDRRHESSMDPDRIPHSTGGDLSSAFRPSLFLHLLRRLFPVTPRQGRRV
ncbi:hypothetical protein CPB84DRAFT_1824808 [Gymnopilus junonius]|uniref:Uncharacterized protein n=1 Tax=Gymnopilus junonius TaxID=109634 RepID=A0A9P5NP87_GYMJU|nr:hypothetical protein CPB84DRAFT_1824808 [Gymnopilus junonius]